jgi:hypothetical protein
VARKIFSICGIFEGQYPRTNLQVADRSETADRGSWRKELVPLLILSVVIVLAAAVFLPGQDVHKTQRANASSAAAKLRWLNEAQQSYAAGHASGFACQLRQLRPAGPVKLDSYGYPYDENERFTSDESSGYLFAISSCQADASGKITQYTVTAAPRELGKTGYSALCTDQSGVIWTDHDGSATKCLLERQNGFDPAP